MIESLLVVDEKGRGLLHLEGRQTSELAALFLEGDLAAHDLADRQPGADIIQEMRWKAHGLAQD